MKFNVSVLGFCFAVLLTACGGGDPYDTGAQKVRLVAEVGTYVGSGRIGNSDGSGNEVEFAGPSGLVLRNGDLFVADGQAIRKVSPEKVVSTVITGLTGGIYGIAIDSAGNIFASSPFSHVIYKISASNPSQAVVFAGTHYTPGFANASSGAAATFNYPMGLTIDEADNLFVADSENQAIRKVTPTGVVSTYAGSGLSGHNDGNGTGASFYKPMGVALDTKGNLFVADAYYGLIRKITQSGGVTTLAGTTTSGDSADGKGDAARIKFPKGLTVDASDNIIVTETDNHMVRKVTPDGVVTTLAGNGTGVLKNGIGGRASFNYPTAISVDRDGVFYIADLSNNIIRSLKMIWI